MNKDVEQHLQELIDFYLKTEIDDVNYLKKLFVRNLKDVQRRYIKYDKTRKNEAIEYNKQLIKGIKDFYRPTADTIYSGDCIIDIAERNLELLGDKE